MLRRLLVLLFVSLAGFSGLAQTAVGKPEIARGIPGTFDPKTSLFTPTPAMLAADSSGTIATAATIFGGKLVFNFTITVTSALPTADQITCTSQASVVDAGAGIVIFEEAAVKATRSGATATCAVSIPYSWSLTTASSDRMSLSYSISGTGTTATTTLPLRLSSQGLGSFAIPANGITSTLTVKATI